ncbi:hypothetical protein [Massilia yuzhufengensis]|uniref:Uncharacterized protein n=1 Tax=Massilia yuzhufengensis TaxID=1164594 RepID=A0A1I1UFR4_9BURK|nr:hypothetical protein [Massilia yuzhufengensis]SFD69534.1 hypothetical protein SAMN05216204_13352 [Massilia yuzhufengensis]
MNNPDPHDALTPCFAALRSELAGIDTPRCVEKELMQAFTRQFAPKRRWYQALSLPQWGTAGALCSLTVVVLLLARSPHDAVSVGGQPLVGFDNGGAFVALDSLERIEAEPDAQLLEADVPRTALASLGMPVSPGNAGDTVRAEMLVAADGHPLAVRLSSAN